MYRQSCFMICFVFLFSVGCSGGKVAERIAEMNSTPIKKLITCYSFYQSRNNFRGPKDEAALREFIADDKNQKGFDRAGIDTSDIDALFISERDGQPFKIKYGVPGSPMGFVEPLIFESEGVDGEVMVGFGGATKRGSRNMDKRFLGEALEAQKFGVNASTPAVVPKELFPMEH